MIMVRDGEKEFESVRQVGKRFCFVFVFGMKMGDVGCTGVWEGDAGDDSDEEEPDYELDVDDEDEGDQEE